MITLIRRLFEHVGQRRRFQFLLLLLLTLASSIAEVVSLSAVIPFIGVMTSPSTIFDNPIASSFFDYLGLGPGDDLVLVLTILFILAAVVAGSLRLLLLWGGIRLVTATGIDLSLSVYRKTLFQPYTVHISRSSSEIISGIALKVSATTGVLIAFVNVVTSSVLFTAILITLLLIDPVIATVAITFFGLTYVVIAFFCHKKLRTNSEIINHEQSNVVKALQEGLGSIRDVLLDGTQDVYCNIFGQAINRLETSNRQNKFINQAPRYFIEVLAMTLIALLTYSLSSREGGFADSLPVLAALALGAHRILPLCQQFYTNWSTAAGSHAVLENVIGLLEQPLPEEIDPIETAGLKFERSINLNSVSFSYGANSPLVLDDVNLLIRKGERLGIVGSTGSGKSTLMDLIMGLLEPSAGNLQIDDVILGESNRGLWQKQIAHVPQHIFLSDASVAENIALGIPADEIDMERVREAARQARISEFIESSEHQYLTQVGERGVRLSGGQRQRIGIARALYKKASVLVFDEATSALDNETEIEVMKAVESLDENLTIILIAHRISTLKNCERIIKLEAGRIVLEDSYANYIETYPA